jgi:hypothetical protein
MTTSPEEGATGISHSLPDRRRRAGVPAITMIAALLIVAVLIVLL